MEFKLYEKAIESKKIFKGLIVLTQYDEELDTEILLMDLDGTKGIIKKEDVDYQMDWKSLVGFVGREIFYTIKEIDKENNRIFCSRKEAQELVENEVLEKLENGETFTATITGIVDYGAYVEIKGIYALLKNTDFSDDFVTVKDILGIGDTINVKLSKVSENNKLIVEPVEKYVLKSVMKFDSFERDQVVLGVVNGIKPWGAYVTIALGLDALCPIPPVGEIEKGSKVSFRITQVQEENKRVRGKILKILK